MPREPWEGRAKTSGGGQFRDWLRAPSGGRGGRGRRPRRVNEFHGPVLPHRPVKVGASLGMSYHAPHVHPGARPRPLAAFARCGRAGRALMEPLVRPPPGPADLDERGVTAHGLVASGRSMRKPWALARRRSVELEDSPRLRLAFPCGTHRTAQEGFSGGSCCRGGHAHGNQWGVRLRMDRGQLSGPTRRARSCAVP